jgi:hypothetical protein
MVVSYLAVAVVGLLHGKCAAQCCYLVVFVVTTAILLSSMCFVYPARCCYCLQFFQKNDNQMNDAFMIATGVAALYLVYKVFEQLETLN